MITFDIHKVEYSVSNHKGFSLNNALRLWKAKFETIKHFRRDVIKHSALQDLGAFVEEVWNNIEPITVQEALIEQNMEIRRVMFDCIGVSKLFQTLAPKKLDSQVLSKIRTRWDGNNKSYQHCFEDVYELYQIDGNKLFTTTNAWQRANDVYAVRCWCTTTNREYWIYVPENIAMGERYSSWNKEAAAPDAVRAIAWTIRLNISNPKRIFRQGDIIVAEESELSTTVPEYHLTKEQYLNLLFSET